MSKPCKVVINNIEFRIGDEFKLIQNSKFYFNDKDFLKNKLKLITIITGTLGFFKLEKNKKSIIIPFSEVEKY